MTNTYDLIIIGGGPAGLSAAIYAGRAERNTLLLEKGGYGGRIKDTSEIKNYPGTIEDTGEGLMNKFKDHAQSYSTNNFIRTTVTGITKDDAGFLIQTKRKGDFRAECVILDTGTKPKTLGIPNEKEFVGHGVAYCATCDAEFFKGKSVYVLGAGDQAIEESFYLTKFANSVTIIVVHEEGHLDCNEVAAEAAFNNPKINFIWNSTLVEILGETKVEGLVLKDVATEEKTSVSADGIFFFIGMTPQTEIVKDFVEMDKNGFILVNEKKETNISGLYAVGDCTQTYLRQVVTAASDGAIAATASERYVKEKRDLDAILNSDLRKITFIFYNPYEREQIDKVAKLAIEYEEVYKVYRIDITRQALLYHQLGIEETIAVAVFDNGKLTEIKNYH
ncbi:NAD(P)/FAD-dependent oxidoreductase [Enterococcus sp. DIV1420a]|uniref:NAD(P)/FAD-dependent oxidoreductase n=1 Tax=Enterococcus sp. DIV1420a TaxID=2774672 RepID=UPI003F26C95D